MEPYIYAAGLDVHLDGDRLYAPHNIPPIAALAHALSHINRFTGHTYRPYSVAEHSLLVFAYGLREQHARVMDDDSARQFLIACLTHDLHEALIGDVTSPVKHILGSQWDQFEARVQGAVASALGLTDALGAFAAEVKECDLKALALEKAHFLKGSGDWAVLQGVDPGTTFVIPSFVDTAEVRDLYLEAFNNLMFTGATPWKDGPWAELSSEGETK